MKWSRPLRYFVDALGPLVLEVTGDPESIDISGASADSRTVTPGCLFVAVPGSRTDGIRFVPEAIARGAAAVAAPQRPPEPFPTHVAFIRVADASFAAARVAEALFDYPARSLRLIGVTGTNGKTTTACLLYEIFRAAGVSTGLLGTVGYTFGGRRLPAERTTPPPFELQRLLAQMRAAGVSTVVMEVSSHALDQHRLGTAEFAAALFTNLTGDHLDYHETMDAYYAAKARLFSEYLAPNGIAVINADDPFGRRLIGPPPAVPESVRLRTFGRCAGADVRIRKAVSSLHGLRVTLAVAGAETHLRLESPMIGAFQAFNLAGAAALAWELGISLEQITPVVERFHGAPGRMTPVRDRYGRLVLVDYAHTDDALEKALHATRGLKPRRLIVVFGCGGDRDCGKRPRMGRVAAAFADVVVLTSDNPRSEDPLAIIEEIRAGIPAGTAAEIHVEPNRRAAIQTAVRLAAPGDAILLAGKGHETYQEFADRRIPFDDRVEAARALRDFPPLHADGVEAPGVRPI